MARTKAVARKPKAATKKGISKRVPPPPPKATRRINPELPRPRPRARFNDIMIRPGAFTVYVPEQLRTEPLHVIFAEMAAQESRIAAHQYGSSPNTPAGSESSEDTTDDDATVELDILSDD